VRDIITNIRIMLIISGLIDNFQKSLICQITTPLNSLLEKKLINGSIIAMSVTYQPNRRKRKKTHGFLVRKRTAGGKSILKARQRKGRAKLTV